MPATLLKKRLWHRCFPVNFVKFLRTLFLIEHVWWRLLDIVQPPYSKIFYVKYLLTSAKWGKTFYKTSTFFLIHLEFDKLRSKSLNFSKSFCLFFEQSYVHMHNHEQIYYVYCLLYDITHLHIVENLVREKFCRWKFFVREIFCQLTKISPLLPDKVSPYEIYSHVVNKS